MTEQSQLRFDPEYFGKLLIFLNGKYSGTVQDLNSAKVTNNKEKLIFHLKAHIDRSNMPNVEFNNDYSKFKVYGHRAFNLNEIDPDFWIITRKRRGYTPIMAIEKPESASGKAKKAKLKSTNNNNEYTEARIEY